MPHLAPVPEATKVTEHPGTVFAFIGRESGDGDAPRIEEASEVAHRSSGTALNANSSRLSPSSLS